jgi:hypothetical protein
VHAKRDLLVPGVRPRWDTIPQVFRVQCQYAQELQLIQAQRKLEKDRREALWPRFEALANIPSLLTKKAHQKRTTIPPSNG